MATPLAVSYDEASDVLTIDGIRYAGNLFRSFTKPDADKLYRLVHSQNNTITLIGVQEAEAEKRGREWNTAFDNELSKTDD